jgi:hypothetical protein
MKRLFVLVALLIMAASACIAQTSPYMIDYFSNNPGPGGAADQQIRLVNYSLQGTPLTSPVGDVCANVYVFDANQELVACCSCRITPNGLISLSIANGLTNNPVTSVVPVNGDVKIVSTAANGAAACTPLTQNGGILNSTVGFGTHLQISGGTAAGTFITETPLATVPIEAITAGPEGPFLLQACQFARYLGSSKGICACK